MMRKITIHKSLYRPVLFVGCERLPFTIVVTLGGVLIMAYQNITILIIVSVLYLTSLIIIRKINENDAQFFLILARFIRYTNDYYRSSEFYPGRYTKSIFNK